MEVRSLAVGPALEGGGAHLHQHLVQPLQGPVQVHLDPAGGGRHGFASVLLAPALHEADPDVEIQTKAIRRFVITEKAPSRAFSWLKTATTAFTFKTLLRHYANRALTPRSLNVKLGPQRNYHKGRAAIRHYANQPARPF